MAATKSAFFNLSKAFRQSPSLSIRTEVCRVCSKYSESRNSSDQETGGHMRGYSAANESDRDISDKASEMAEKIKDKDQEMKEKTNDDAKENVDDRAREKKMDEDDDVEIRMKMGNIDYYEKKD